MAEAAKPTVFELFAAVKREVRPVGKDSKNEQQHFNFRGIDAVVNAAAPALDRHGVITVPLLGAIEYATVEVGQRRTPMAHVRVTVTYRFTGPAGDSFDATVPGEAMDVGDKATAKAMSVAYRIALLQALNLPTSDADPDSQTYERSPARQDDSWRDQPPVNQPRGGQGNGRPVQDTADVSQWEKPAEPVTDTDWMRKLVDDLIPAAKDTDTLNRYWADGLAKHAKGELTTDHWEEIKSYIRDCARDIGPADTEELAQVRVARNDPT